MKLNIGDIVKYLNDNDYAYIVIATTEHPLNVEYLKSYDGNLKIDKIVDFVNSGINVPKGFDYGILKILSFEGEIVKTDSKPKYVFEGDIKR